MKIKLNNKGFTHLEIALIIFLAIAISGVGYMVYKNQNKDKKSETVAVKKSETKPKVKDPYEGWKSMCSDVGGLCMKYPSTWTLTQEKPPSNIDGYYGAYNFKNPATGFNIIYLLQVPAAGTGNNMKINVVDVMPTKAKGLSVYSVISEDLDKSSDKPFASWLFISRDNLKSTDDRNTYSKGNSFEAYETSIHRFDNPNNPDSPTKQNMQIQEYFKSYQDAEAWFNSPNINNAKLIMQSASYK